MSPRPKRLRKVSNLPVISGFKPYGSKCKNRRPGTIFILFEEYEALRLCDHELLNQDEAARIMGISRPTLTRIYAEARRKIAEAFVHGHQIMIEGGMITFDSEWYYCSKCCAYFNHPDTNATIFSCPLCGDEVKQNSSGETESI